ncbi:MAG: C/D box methylation guide ribonucleoprotein complex aNOP56 subunit [Candidatus Aenigmarchaeota archaeon]|nr:C/D box methylation guide ribonucleoprotein complex aNOP56 subunit [Candidatus Aenigmarchaeota archaeon]
MKCYITISPLGVFGISEKGEIIKHVPFSKDSILAAKKILDTGVLPEENDITSYLKKIGYNEFISSKRSDIYELEHNNFGDKLIRKKMRTIAKTINLNEQDLNKYLTDLGIEITRIETKQTVKKDKIVMEAIDAIDELDKSINIFVSRLREWYGLHFPELNNIVDNHEKYVKIVSAHGLRDNITDENFLELVKNSMGIDLNKKDEETLKEFSNNILNLYKLRNNLEAYVEFVLNEIAPNFSSVAGHLLAARLISLAGGLEKLAKKPSSTIQLLGAEKALFRYLHGHGRSPKHGSLYMHNLIQQAPFNKKGKIARILAAKLSIAIKMDYYGNTNRSNELKKELEDRIKGVMLEKD